MQLRVLSAADVVRALPMVEAIEGMKRAFAALSSGNVEMPLRARVSLPDEATTLLMPASLVQSGEFGIKIVSVHPLNPHVGLPLIHALVLVLDPATGQPRAIMEGGTLTAIRTGAGAGAATDVLAREDAENVAIIGSGVQARTQLEAVCAVRQIKQVTVFSPHAENARTFAAEMAGKERIPTEIRVAASADEAIADADIICTATTSFSPVFDGHLLKEGTHINAVGSYLPEMQEVDAVTIQRAYVTVDARSSVMAEAGDLLVPIKRGEIDVSHIRAEIGEVINGTAPGRTSTEQITYFKSCGVAVQDAVAASIALRYAERLRLGQVNEM